ncbi:MAG: GGDEF domain-containing protein [Deltaproteobacteria bacterium]|nr:GGDEF domain-containing protein [Deltaproteobacteria bacterium]
MTSSLGIFVIMIFPTIKMLINKNTKTLIKSVGVLYGIFLLLLLIRAGYGMYNPHISVLSTNLISSMVFLVLFLQFLIAIPSYAVILKDYANEALLLMATTDNLTGATNRHAFMGASSAIYNNLKFFRTSVSIIFIDIDHFKQVNDTYGHAFGDIVLTRMAAIIDSCRRNSDLSCRYGGEEFLVMLPRTGCEAAELVARRILNEARAARFAEHPEFSFTVSIGVFCGVPSSEQSFAALIRAADDAMYQAKHLGRDQIVVRSVVCDNDMAKSA